MKYLVVDVGGTFTKYGVMDEEGNFYQKDKIPTRQKTLEDFVQMLVELFENNRQEVSGIALSMAGMIDSDSGFLYNGGSIFCLSNINIVELLGMHCHVPVTVENDARCAALAELWKGSLKDCTNGVAVICGTAIGGAVICDRKVVRGKNCMAGEFSYVLTDSKDSFNSDKTLANTGGVPALIRLAAKKKGIPENELDGEKIFSMANCGDEEMLGCIREFSNGMAVQITNYQFIFDPERIAIGGGISAQPLFIQMVKEELTKLNRVYPHPVPIPEITPCEFFNDSNLIGALYVHLKSKEEQLNPERVKELMHMLKDRREGRYLREFLME